MAISDNDAFALLQQYLPPGLTAWQDLSSTGAIGKMWRAVGKTVKLYGFDVLDTLRAELGALTMNARLPDWEDILGLAQSRLAAFGTLVQRRAQVIGRRREWGTPTSTNIQSSLAAVCGYSPTILEVSRAALKAVHSYNNSTSGTITGGGSVTQTVKVLDEPKVSLAGAQLIFHGFGTSNAADVSVTLTAPGGSSKTWTGVTAFRDSGTDPFCLAWPEATGLDCLGTWQLQVSSVSSNVNFDGWDVFVEAIGRNAYGIDGQGAEIFEWGAFIDSTRIDPSIFDRAMVREQVKRWNAAHTIGDPVWDSVLDPGVLGAVPDDELAIPDECVPV